MKKYIGILFGAAGLTLFVLSFMYENVVFFFMGIPLLLLGIFLLIFMMVYDLYEKDKKIDYELVKKHGFHLVKCSSCGKENVLEDQYCVYCGERLDQDEV